MARFPFTLATSDPGSQMPRLALQLSSALSTVQVIGLIDTGSPVNVLPFGVGLALGYDWNRQRQLGPLGGALASADSRVISVTGTISQIPGALDVPLPFAWSESDTVPVLLGQTNFLMEFNVCFYRSQNYFEVWRRA